MQQAADLEEAPTPPIVLAAIEGAARPGPVRPQYALGVLCATVLLERLAFYLMMSLFALYLNERRGCSVAQASSACGWFVGLSYFAAIFGGLIADRYSAYLRAIQLGVAVMAAGFLALATEIVVLPGALALLILGQGLCKTNLTTLIGRVPGVSSESAYRAYYIAINLGAVGAPALAYWAHRRGGYAAVFALAAVVTSAALLVCFNGERWLVLRPVPAAALSPPLAQAGEGSAPSKEGRRGQAVSRATATRGDDGRVTCRAALGGNPRLPASRWSHPGN